MLGFTALTDLEGKLGIHWLLLGTCMVEVEVEKTRHSSAWLDPSHFLEFPQFSSSGEALPAACSLQLDMHGTYAYDRPCLVAFGRLY